MTYPTYPKYKDSGFEWLGKVPSNWGISRLGSQFEERKQTVSDVDYQPLSVTKDGIVPQLDTAAKTDYGDNRKLVKAGDFVINSRSDRKGSAGISPSDGSVSVISTVLRPRSLNLRFTHHLLRSCAFQEEFYRFGTGIVADLWSTRYSAMKMINLPVPSPPEQFAIADFLDRETARIDALIAKQEQLIATLREERSVVVDSVLDNHGFPAPRALSNSQSWQLPAGWRIIRLGTVLQQLTNGFVGPTRDILVDEGVPYIQSMHIKQGRIDFARRPFYVRKEWHEERPRIHLREGDVLIVQTGDIGKVAVVPSQFGDASCHALQIARVKPDILSGDYLGTFLSSHLGFHYLRSLATGALHPHLEAGIRAAPIVIPPLEIQPLIVREVGDRTAQIDALIAKSEEMIATLREYRSALITDAVTGKIDVRGVA